MKKFWFLLVCFTAIQWTYAQSTITIGIGSSVAVGNGSNLSAGYRDGTMTSTGYFNSRSITFDPVATAATSVTQTSFSANWNASSGANGYKVDVSTVSNFTSFVTGYQNLDVGIVTSFSVSSLSAGTTYYYRVRAYDIDGITGYSNVIAVTTAPVNPTATAATNINDISFSANWNSVSGATGYRLDVSKSAGFTVSDSVAGFWNKNVGNVTTYSITGLLGNTTYYYRIRAYNGNGISDNSNTTTVLTAPAAPNAIAALPIGQTSFTAKWRVSVGATKYYLDVSTVSNFASYVTGYQNIDVGSDTTYSVGSNISAGTTYYYRVRASNGTSTSTNSNTMNLITVPPDPVIAAATNILGTSFTANWNTATGATKYYLDVSTDSNFGTGTFVTDYEDRDVGNVITFSVNANLSGGVTYYYRVRAYNTSGTSGNSGTTSVFTIPLAPVVTAADPIAQTSFSAKWNASVGATKYYLDVATDNSFINFVTGWNNVDVGGAITYPVNTNINSGTTYYYRVRANNATGTSINSDAQAVTTVPPDPVLLAGTNANESSFYANWNSSTSATGYELDVSDQLDFSTRLAGYDDLTVLNVTTYLVSGLSPSTNYYYRVRAYNGSGTSGNTGQTEQITAPATPTLAAVGTITQTSFEANWNTAAGVDGYRLDVSTDAGFGSGTFVTGYENKDVGMTVPFLVDTYLTEGTTYHYRVRAYNASGTSTSSLSASVTTKPPNPIEKPATVITSSGFTANWNEAVSATAYLLDVSENSGFTSFVTNYENKSISDVTAPVTGLNAGITYYYRVSAVNASGESGNSGTITVLIASAAPTATAATSKEETRFTANWVGATNATGYLLDVSTNPNCTDSYVDGYNNFDVGNVTSFIVEGLSGGTTYYYRLRAYNVSGNGAYSNIESAKTLSPPPVALPATPISETSFTAKWNAATGADNYSLYVAEDENFTSPIAGYNPKSVAGLSDAITAALTAGTPYYYRVEANNASGGGASSNIINVTTLPSAPTGTVADNETSTSFIAHWDITTGATGYRLSVSESDFTAGDSVAGFWNRNVGNVTNYSVTGLSANTTYYFQVKAYNNSGTGANSASTSVTTLNGTPDIPSVKPATPVDSSSFIANWNAVTGATGYYLDVSTVSGFGSFVLQNQSVAGTSYTVSSSISPGETYYYRVRATNAVGTSGNSNIVTVKVIPPKPIGLITSNETETSFDADWAAANGATGYRLDVSTDAGFTAGNFVPGFENKDIGNVITYTVTGLSGGTTYYYQIRAYNTGGTSVNSDDNTGVTSGGGSFYATNATAITAAGFTANWIAYGGADYYLLYVATDAGFVSTLAGYDGLNVNLDLNRAIVDLDAGTNYYYKLEAYNSTPTLLATSGIINVLTLPGTPAPAVADQITETSFNAKWTAPTGIVTGYYLSVATNTDFSSYVSGYTDKYVNSTLEYPVTGLTGGTTYYYKVKAKNGSGDGSYSTSYTTVKTIPHKPVAVNATEITGSGFKANWNASTGADGYNLIVSTNSDLSAPISNTDVGNQTFGNVSGSSGTTYYYGVKAYTTGSGSSDASNIISVLTLPDKPGILTASPIDKTSFTARWNSSVSATKYYLDVATSNTFTGAYVAGYQNLDAGNSTTFPVTGLAKGTTYYYRVRAFNASGVSENSDIQEVLTFPSEPTVQSATNIQSASFTANWLAAAGAVQYYVDVSTTSNFSAGTFTTEGPIASPAVLYNASGLTAANYYYRVKAYNANGSSGFSGTMAVLLAPDAPVANSSTSITASSFIAGWNSSSGADGYKIDVYTDAGFTTFVPGYNNKDVGSATSVTVTGLLSGINYYYQVRAYSAGRTSDNSNMITTLTKPAAPVAAAALSVTNNSFTAQWGALPNVTYYLEVATNNGFTSLVAGYNPYKDVGVATTEPVGSLTANTHYYYRIRSHNASGESAYSGTIHVLTAPSIPTLNAETSITNTSFTANWIPSTGATGYKLDVSLNSGFTSFVDVYDDLDVGNVIAYTINNLNGSTQYYYRLRAYNGSGGTSNNTSTPGDVTTAPEPSGVPTVTSETAVTLTSFNANWNLVAGASGYKLDVSTNQNFLAGTFVTGYYDRNVGNVTTYSVTGLTSATAYYYRVRSFNVSGTSSSSVSEEVLTLPVAPTANAAAGITSTSFTANWSSSPSASKYYLDVSTDENFAAGLFVTGYEDKDVGLVTSYSVNTNILGGTTYYYRIRAYNISGPSANSATITVLTLPSAPTATAATLPSTSGFTANWGVVAGADGYKIDISDNSGFTSYVSGYEDKDVSGNSIIVTGLNSGINYYYRVRAYNNSGTSENSGTITALTSPSAPTATAASTVTGTSFSANWNAVTGASKYYLDVSTDIGFGSYLAGYQDEDVGNVLTYSVAGLTVNTNYYYRLRAYNSAGISISSNIITVLTAPLPPVATDATASGENNLTANWNASVGATGYRLDVSTDNGFGVGTFESGYEDLDVGNVTTYSVTGISSGYTHYYRVRAYNAGGTSTNSGTIKVLGVPNAIQATDITVNSFTANWNPVTNILGYRLDVATSIDFSAGTFHSGLENKDVGNVTTYPISGLISNTTYYYRVRAYDATMTSGNSNTILVKNRPNPPVAVAATNIGNTGFTANWNASAGGAAGYKIDVATDAGFTSFVSNFQDSVVYNTTSFIINNLLPGRTYYYRVRAYNSLGDSDNSGTISVITLPYTPNTEEATDVTQISFTANWTIAIGTTSYLLDVSTDQNFLADSILTGYNNKTIIDNRFAVTGLTPGTIYYYRVKSVYPSATSGYSNTSAVVTISPNPVMVAATNVLMQSFTANWDSTKGATGYRIDVSKDQDFADGQFVAGFRDKDVGNIKSYSVTGLNPNVAYYCRVKSYNSSGTSGYSNVIKVTTPPSNSLAKPATFITQTSFSANWEASTGSAGYKLDLSTDQNFVQEFFIAGYNNKDVGNVTTYSIGGLIPGKIYYYRIRPYNVERVGESSNIISLITIPANPVALAATNITSQKVKVNWNKVTGASSYKLDVSTSSSFSSFVQGYQNFDLGDTTTYLIDTNLRKAAQHFYRIRSYNVGGSSGNSNVISFTTLPNIKPVLSGVETTVINYLEESSPAQITNTIAIADSDNTELSSARILISGNYQKNADILGFTNQNGINGVWNNETGTMILSGNSSLQNYKGALRSITYYNSSKMPSKLPRAVTFTVNDGIDNSVSSGNTTRTINVIPVNNPPDLTGIEKTDLEYLEGSGAVNISTAIIPSDVDNVNIINASIKIARSYKIGEDVLGFTNQNGITGYWNETSGSLLLDGSASIDSYRAALRSVTYTNTSNKPSAENRTINFFVKDSTSSSVTISRSIHVIPVNTPPVLSNIETAPVDYKIKQGQVQITNSLVIEDADCESTGSAAIEITGNYIKEEDSLLCAADTSIAKTWNSQLGKMIFGGNLSVNACLDIIKSISYKNSAALPAPLERTITITYFDGKNNSNSISRKINMPSVNIAPVLSEIEKSKIVYKKNNPPVYLTDSLEIKDEDNINLFGADVLIASHFRADEDILTFSDTKNISGFYDLTSGKMELRGQETIAGYKNAIKSVMYNNSKGEYAVKTIKKIKFTAWDGIAFSDTLTRELDVDGLIVGIDEDMDGIPTEYSMQQNFPNPFNPVTVIKYALPKPGNVKLIIYNILGEAVSVLIDKEQSAGYYKINFDAGRYASGIYLYRIQSGDFSMVKKMLLVK